MASSFPLYQLLDTTLSSVSSGHYKKEILMFKQGPLFQAHHVSANEQNNAQSQIKLATGNAKSLLKISELEPMSTEVTVKCGSLVGVGWELYSSSLITTLNGMG